VIRRNRQPDTVYLALIEARGIVKIGVTSNIGTRLRQIAWAQRVPAAEVVPIGIYSGSRLTERRIHARFAHLRIEGEWFRYTDEIYQFMERLDAGLEHHMYGRPL